MKNSFGLPRKEIIKEFDSYKGEIGLVGKQNEIHYGIIANEDFDNVYLNPHIAYNPIPLPDGETISNPELRKTIKKIPKTLLSKLVHEYNDGYFETLINSIKNKDTFVINKYNNLFQQTPKKLSFKEKLIETYKIFKQK